MTTDDGKHAPTPSDARVAELLKDATEEYNGAANTNDYDAGAFWGPMKDALLDLQAKRNSHATLLRERDELRRALEAQHKWSEALSNRIRDAVYASEELKDPLAFKYLDEDFFNGVAASYEDGYVAALTASADKADSKSGGG